MKINMSRLRATELLLRNESRGEHRRLSRAKAGVGMRAQQLWASGFAMLYAGGWGLAMISLALRQ
jgi:hypothetical protein